MNEYRLLIGGERIDTPEHFPVINPATGNAAGEMRIVDEEQFGRALPIIRYEDVEDALRQANQSPYGLGGSIWSGSEAPAWELAARLECGTAWVNRHGDIRPDTPFGGIKSLGAWRGICPPRS